MHSVTSPEAGKLRADITPLQTELDTNLLPLLEQSWPVEAAHASVTLLYNREGSTLWFLIKHNCSNLDFCPVAHLMPTNIISNLHSVHSSFYFNFPLGKFRPLFLRNRKSTVAVPSPRNNSFLVMLYFQVLQRQQWSATKGSLTCPHLQHTTHLASSACITEKIFSLPMLRIIHNFNFTSVKWGWMTTVRHSCNTPFLGSNSDLLSIFPCR